jgi:hypothetical protein
LGRLDGRPTLNVFRMTQGPGRLLVAMQQARGILQPLEPYTSLVEGRAETYPSKAAQWALHLFRIETRFPGFGIVDTRLDMLGALAGMAQSITEEMPYDREVLHRCNEVAMFNPLYPELDTLSGLMVWDRAMKRMVLPETMTRNNVAAALTTDSLGRLDALVNRLAQADEADFSANDARILREAIRALTIRPPGFLSVDPASPYADAWNLLLEGTTVVLEPTTRLVFPALAEESVGYIPDRRRAMSSPEVAAILGPRLLAALTHPVKAYQLRDLTLRTRASQSAKAN